MADLKAGHPLSGLQQGVQLSTAFQRGQVIEAADMLRASFAAPFHLMAGTSPSEWLRQMTR